METDENSYEDSDSYDECCELECVDKVENEDNFSYNALTPTDVVDDMLKLIAEVNSVVQIPPTIIRILLNHFNWDTEKLYERYFSDEGDLAKLFEEAHIVNPFGDVPRKKMKLMKESKTSSEMCKICYRKISCKSMTSLACDHRYCTECWKMYITTKINDQGEVQYISCFAVDCDILVDDQTIMNLLDDANVKTKYQNLITNNYIVCNRRLKHCPQPGCVNVIKVEYSAAQPVKCTCGHTFCFSCLENWHGPVTCSFLKKWKTKCFDDSATLNWIAANTKECPSCSAKIEKNGGCNHMTCKNQVCKFEFCWLCLRAWNSHEFHWDVCNRYNEELSKRTEKSKSALDKFMFYFDRYSNHVASLKFENVLHDSVEKKIRDLQRQHISWNEAQFLSKAVDILCECRQTLMYTYVFAYYLDKDNESSIFEANQNDLQNAVEELSGFLENDISEDTILTLKQKVQDKSRYCDSRRRVLLNHVHEGYDKETWKFWET